MTANEDSSDVVCGDGSPDLAAKAVRLVRRGSILVKPATGRKIGAAEADTALRAVRERNLED